MGSYSVAHMLGIEPILSLDDISREQIAKIIMGIRRISKKYRRKRGATLIKRLLNNQIDRNKIVEQFGGTIRTEFLNGCDSEVVCVRTIINVDGQLIEVMVEKNLI